jgi:hypothetical protein
MKHRTWQQDFYDAAERGDSEWIVERFKKSRRYQRSTFVRYSLLKAAIVMNDIPAIENFLNNLDPALCRACFLNRFLNTETVEDLLGHELCCSSE